MVLPDGVGPDLPRRLRANHNGLRVVSMSGYEEGVLRSRGSDRANDVLLPKPLSFDDLKHAIAASLRPTGDA